MSRVVVRRKDRTEHLARRVARAVEERRLGVVVPPVARHADPPPVLEHESGECRAEVRGNGQFYRIAGTGLRPGEVVSFHLENADVRPVEYRLIANSDGAWRQFYVPFLWHREGGTVRVDLQSATCTLSLSFGWERRRP